MISGTFPTFKQRRRRRRGRQRVYTPSTPSFDTGTIDEKTLARQLHKHDANDGAVLDDNNCAARFSARARVDITFHAIDATSYSTGGGARAPLRLRGDGVGALRVAGARAQGLARVRPFCDLRRCAEGRRGVWGDVRQVRHSYCRRSSVL